MFGTVTSAYAYFDVSKCTSEGRMAVSLEPTVWHPANGAARLNFAAPDRTRIIAVEGNRASAAGPGGPGRQGTTGMDVGGSAVEVCNNATACSRLGSGSGNLPSNFFAFSNLSVGTFHFYAACFGGESCPPENPKAEMNIYRAHFTLSDSDDPTASPVTGPLVNESVKTGTLSARYTASDKGGGVYRTLMKIDGKIVDVDVIDSNGGSCRDALPGGSPYDGFTRALPCELTSAANPTLDTSVVPDGSHQLSLEIEDAAGNRNVLFAPTTFTFRNGTGPGGGAPNGTNATKEARISFQARSATRRSVRFGRAINVIGRLRTPSGEAIEGASLDVLERVKLRGESARRVATVGTDRRGFFKYVATAGPSRNIDIGYKAVLPATLDGLPAVDYDAREQVVLEVSAGVRLAVRPRVARNLQRLRFVGRLLGRPLPRRGRVVLIQARVKRLRKVSWQTFLTLRTDRKGLFAGSYRLTRSVGATGYRFRAVVPRGEDYPYGTGASRVSKVKIVR
ncbi:MAG: hypothetical protein ACR2ML_09040 [Solirubrobacteraceae bacterium]